MGRAKALVLNEEIDFIEKMLLHPAGFHFGIFAIINARSTDDATFEVEWELDPGSPNLTDYKSFDNARDAAKFFAELRRELEIGVDIEARLNKEAGLIE